jgi:hypothetical protein
MKGRLLHCFFLLIFISGAAFAQRSGVGAGIIAGEPTGITLKNWLSKTTAFDVAVAWSFDGPDDFHLHGDYLLHNFSVFKPRKGLMPLYFGLGGRIKFSDKTRVGLRGVIGVDYLFQSAPVDIFLEVAPIFDFTPDTDFSFNAAIGFRYFF